MNLAAKVTLKTLLYIWRFSRLGSISMVINEKYVLVVTPIETRLRSMMLYVYENMSL